MTDRLIFRAWDKVRKQWRDDFFIDPFGRYRVFVDDDGDKNGLHEHDESSLHDLIIVQSTGLRDKAGKLIFEGDVVHFWNGLGEKYVGEVRFNDGCFDVVSQNTRYGTLRDYLKVHVVNHAIEIIGSIYENPELLKG